jgi:hypothetical protein
VAPVSRLPLSAARSNHRESRLYRAFKCNVDDTFGRLAGFRIDIVVGFRIVVCFQCLISTAVETRGGAAAAPIDPGRLRDRSRNCSLISMATGYGHNHRQVFEDA